jgi:Sec23/Sec24 zinc finger
VHVSAAPTSSNGNESKQEVVSTAVADEAKNSVERQISSNSSGKEDFNTSQALGVTSIRNVPAHMNNGIPGYGNGSSSSGGSSGSSSSASRMNYGMLNNFSSAGGPPPPINTTRFPSDLHPHGAFNTNIGPPPPPPTHSTARLSSSMGTHIPSPPPYNRNPSDVPRHVSPPHSRTVSAVAPPKQKARIDMSQIPRPPKPQKDIVYNTRSASGRKVPPLSSSIFKAVDKGNCSPRQMRITMCAVPSTKEALGKTGIPLAIVVTPFAGPENGEEPVHSVDMGESPPRCVKILEFSVLCPLFCFVYSTWHFSSAKLYVLFYLVCVRHVLCRSVPCFTLFNFIKWLFLPDLSHPLLLFFFFFFYIPLSLSSSCPPRSYLMSHRCSRCGGYVNPSVVWGEGGNKWGCNLCGTFNTTPSWYVQYGTVL